MPWSWEGAGGSGPAADLEALGQNLEHLAALQFLCTAAGEHAGVRNLVQRLIGRVEAHFGEARGKPHLADERLQAVDALERHRKVVFALGVDAPHLARPAGELRGRLGGQVAVKRRVDDGEPHTVIGVGVGAVLVLDHVALEVGYLADLQHAVLGHGGVIDKLAARIEVLVVVRDDAHIADDVFLDGEVDVIGDVGFARSPEIAFHAMRERIEGAAHELRMRHGQRKPRIERRPPRQRADERALHMRLLVGDDPAVVLLGTRAGERDDAAHGDERARHLAVGVLERLDVLVKHRLRGDHLAAVEDRPAADGEDEVDLLLACERGAFLSLLVGRVGHDAAEVHHALARARELIDHVAVDAGSFDRTSAVGEHHCLAHSAHLGVECLVHGPLAEVVPDRVVVRE